MYNPGQSSDSAFILQQLTYREEQQEKFVAHIAKTEREQLIIAFCQLELTHKIPVCFTEEAFRQQIFNPNVCDRGSFLKLVEDLKIFYTELKKFKPLFIGNQYNNIKVLAKQIEVHLEKYTAMQGINNCPQHFDVYTGIIVNLNKLIPLINNIKKSLQAEIKSTKGLTSKDEQMEVINEGKTEKTAAEEILEKKPQVAQQEIKIDRGNLASEITLHELSPLLPKAVELGDQKRDSSNNLKPILNTLKNYLFRKKQPFFLPDEILLHLLGFIPHQELLKLARICTQFNAVVDENSLWINVPMFNRWKLEKKSVNDFEPGLLKNLFVKKSYYESYRHHLFRSLDDEKVKLKNEIADLKRSSEEARSNICQYFTGCTGLFACAYVVTFIVVLANPNASYIDLIAQLIAAFAILTGLFCTLGILNHINSKISEYLEVREKITELSAVENRIERGMNFMNLAKQPSAMQLARLRQLEAEIQSMEETIQDMLKSKTKTEESVISESWIEANILHF